MFDQEEGGGSGFLGVMVMMVMFIGTVFVLLFKAGIITCETTGKFTKWGVARFKNRNT